MGGTTDRQTDRNEQRQVTTYFTNTRMDEPVVGTEAFVDATGATAAAAAVADCDCGGGGINSLI